jgi:hypothetical protein
MAQPADSRSRLLASIERLSVRARQIVLLQACSFGLLITLASFWLLALLDWLVHFQHASIRWLSFSLLLLAVVQIWRHVVRPGLVYRPDLVSTARQVEARFPQLGQRLSSCLAFLLVADGRPLARMESRLLAQVEEQLADLSLEGCLCPQRARRAMLSLAVLLALFIGWLGWQPASSLLAAGRLVQPWSSKSWPQRHQLQLVDPPRRVAAGGTYRVQLRDQRGRMPSRVVFEVIEDGEVTAERHELTSAAAEVEFELGPVRRSFKLRAIGGDDFRMPWHAVEVLEAARIEEIELQIESPAYTGRSSELTRGDLHILAGSRLDATLQLDRRCQSVQLVFESEDGLLQFSKSLVADAAGRSFRFGKNAQLWSPTASGSYWFEIESDVSSSSRHWRLELVTDAPPVVTFTLPADNQLFWYRALLPIVADVRDDLQVKDIQLRYRAIGEVEQPEQLLVLEQLPQLPAAAAHSTDGDHRQLNYLWDLARLADLSPDMSIQFELLVTDHAGNTATSTPRTMQLVSRQQVLDMLRARQLRISESLRESAQRAVTIQQRMEQLRDQLDNPAGNEALGGQLQQLLLHQQQLGEQLGRQPAGLFATAEELRQAIHDNRLQGVDIEQQLDRLLAGLERLNGQLLPLVEQHLAASWKLAGTTESAGQRVEEVTLLLGQASRLQADVITELQQLAGRSAHADRFRSLLSQLEQRVEEQLRLQRETRTLQLQRITDNPAGETGSPADLLASIERQQQQLGDHISQLWRDWRELASRPELDESHRQAIQAALDLGRQVPLEGLQLDALQAIQDHQLGRAVDGMAAIHELLDRMAGLLRSRHGEQLQEATRIQAELSDQLNLIINRQRQAAQELAAAEASTDDGARPGLLRAAGDSQQQLTAEIQQLEQQLPQLQQASDLAGWLHAAAAASHVAEQAVGAGQLEEARESQQQVVVALRAADQLLHDEQLRDQARLASQEMDRLSEPLKQLRADQWDLLQRTRVLARRATDRADGITARDLRIAADQLGQRQESLGRQSAALADSVVRARAIQLALESVAGQMAEAGQVLGQGQIGQPVQQLQQRLLALLDEIVAALEGVLTAPAATADDPPGAAEPQLLGHYFRSPAEIRLLVSLQKQINQQTRLLETARKRQGAWTEEQQQEVAQLVQQQQELIELIESLRQVDTDSSQPTVEASEGEQP